MALCQPNRVRSSNLSLFQFGDDYFQLFCSWLSIKSISDLDVAISNGDDRPVWLKYLGIIDADSINEYSQHCHDSIRWLITRGIRTTRINWSPRMGTINDTTFIGFGSPSKHLNRDNMTENCLGTGGFSMVDCVSLDFTGADICTDKIIKDIARGCPQLNTILLGNNEDLTDESLIELARWCPQIHTIDLSHISKITGGGLSALARGCCQMQSINLNCNYCITDRSVSLLASCCPLLHTVKLGNQNGFDALDVDQEHQIIETNIKALVENCPQLRYLSLHYWPSLRRDFLMDLEIRFPHVQINEDYHSESDYDDDGAAYSDDAYNNDDDDFIDDDYGLIDYAYCYDRYN